MERMNFEVGMGPRLPPVWGTTEGWPATSGSFGGDGAVADDAVAAVALGLEEGQVGAAEEVLGVRRVAGRGRGGHAEAAGGAQRGLGGGVLEVGELLAERLGAGGGAVEVRLGEDQGQLLSAEAGGDVGGAGVLAQHPADVAEDLVAHRVAEAVV